MALPFRKIDRVKGAKKIGKNIVKDGMKVRANKSAAEIFKWIFRCLSIAFFLYGAVIIQMQGGTQWFNFFGFILGAVFFAVSLSVDFFISLPIPVKIATLFLFIIAFTVFVAVELAIIARVFVEPPKDCDYVVILGAKVNGISPSLTLRERIRKAAEYLVENPGSKAVATGGMGEDEDMAEGAVIKRELISLGISGDRILVEDRSSSTEENFTFARGIIEVDGGSRDSSVVIVSSSFHLARARAIALGAGYSRVDTLGSPTLAVLKPFYYAREFAAIMKQGVNGTIALADIMW